MLAEKPTAHSLVDGIESEPLRRDPMSEMSNTAEVDARGARRISRPAQMLQILRGKRPKDTGLEPLPGNGTQVDLMHGDLLAKPGLEGIRIMRNYGCPVRLAMARFRFSHSSPRLTLFGINRKR